MKRCSSCKVEKPLDAFHKRKASRDGLAYRCKQCSNATSSKWALENPDRVREIKAKSLEKCGRTYTEEQLENRRRAAQKRRQDDPEKHRKQDAEYRQNNPDKVKSARQKRRAFESKAVGTCTAEQLRARFDYYDNRCAYCGCGGPMEADHQIPLSRGGTNWPANMVPACRSCNASKGSKTPKEFRDSI